jgi:hypothetical protein
MLQNSTSANAGSFLNGLDDYTRVKIVNLEAQHDLNVATA